MQQVDAQLKHETEHILSALYLDNDNLIVLNPKELREKDFLEFSENSFFLQVYDDNQKIILRSTNISQIDQIPTTIPEFKEKYHFENIRTGDYNLRACYAKISSTNSSKSYIIQLAVIDKLFDRIVYKIMTLNLISFPFVVLFIILLSLLLVRRSFQPINAIIDIANKISASNLKERINYNTEADIELDRLKETLNNLFERLEDQVDRITHFTDNASHQLMTPLTAIQSELDYVLKKKRTNEVYLESLSAVRDQTTRLINIIKSMLILAKQDDLTKQSINIFNISNLFYREIIPLYKDYENISFEVEKNIYCKGNPEYVAIIIYNLIDNALKYSPNNTPVKVKLEETKQWISISIEDFGIGIPKAEQSKIFERFYRSERTDKLGLKGYGLGLSLVKTIVESLSGKIEIDSEIDKGTKFTVYLPKVRME